MSKDRHSWQGFALNHIVDEKRGFRMLPGHMRRIGNMMCLLTIDKEPLPGDDGRLAWHSSISFVLGIDRKFQMPVSPSLDNWDEKKWEGAINMCRVMLRLVGSGPGTWTGSVTSLNLWKKLSDEEIKYLGEGVNGRVVPVVEARM